MTAAQVEKAYGYALEAATVEAWRRAVDCAAKGELAAAVEALQGALVHQPGLVPAMVQLAHWLLGLDRYREARKLAHRAAEAVPVDADLSLEIIRLLRRFEDIQSIEALVDASSWVSCASGAVLLRVASELAPVGLHGQARTLLELAERKEPSLPQISHLRATLQLVSGEIAPAHSALRRLADARAPGEAQIRWLLSLSASDEKRAERDADVLTIRLDQVPPGREDEAYLSFALHNVLHRLGRHDEAWTALQRGCRVKRHLVRYRRTEQLQLFQQLHDLPRLEPLHHRPGEEGPELIFIVGMHRSGTTLLERILGGHDEVTDGGETYAFSAALRAATDHQNNTVLDLEGARRSSGMDIVQLRAEFMRHARWKAAGRGWLTEKLPSNFLNLGFILAALPSARVLHMRRDAMDTCFSNLRTYFSNAAGYSYDQDELAEYFRHYRRLMSHWHRLWPGRILDVDYEALVADPATQARKVTDFCGLEYRPAVLDVARPQGVVATASIADVRSGIHKDRGGVWRRYAGHLQPLVDGLAAGLPADQGPQA